MNSPYASVRAGEREPGEEPIGASNRRLPAAVLIQFSVLVCFFIHPYGFARNPDPDPGKRVRPSAVPLKFKLYRGYLILTHGAICDLDNLNLVVDTGTDPTIIDQRVARRLQLNRDPASMATLDGRVPAGQLKLPRVQIGPITSRNLGVLVQDLSFLENGLGTRVDALVGLDVLGQSSFVVDYRAGEIRFGSPGLQGAAVGFAHKPPFVTVVMTLDGHPAELLVDTGASSLMLFKARMATEAFKPGRIRRHSQNFAGRFDRQQVELARVSLGASPMGGQTAFLVEDRDRGRSQQFDGLLNPATLGLRRFSFDFKQGQLGWTR